uniref:Nucleotid_trans domain-containing protein n=1 Tax=Rhabditophanes sp. KR3021 TaxID=114890 RepID=A0AC35UCM9_9BILA
MRCHLTSVIYSFVLAILLFLIGIHLKKQFFSPAKLYAIITVLEELSDITKYNISIETVQCYSLHYNYSYVLISPQTHLYLYFHCAAIPDSMFRRHCLVAAYMNKHSYLDYALIIDADTLLINPTLKLEQFFPIQNESILMYDRIFNAEVAMGSMFIKNNEYALKFLLDFAHFFHLLPNSFYGNDNGAVHAFLILRYLARNSSRERDVCLNIWKHSRNWQDVKVFIACARHLINKLYNSTNSIDNGLLTILPKTSTLRWIRDGWLTGEKWCGSEFLLHGYKESDNTFSKTPLLSFNKPYCVSHSFATTWHYNTSLKTPCYVIQHQINNWIVQADNAFQVDIKKAHGS